MDRRPLLCLALASLAIPVVAFAAPSVMQAAPMVRPVRVLVTPAPAPAGHHCDVCASWTRCEDALHGAGASVQLVAIRNGMMRVYTAVSPSRIRLVQSALARHDEYLRSLDDAAGAAHLCPGCRAMRGAAASGKLVRQVMTVEKGCITVATSADPGVVSMIRAQAGPVPSPGRPPRN